MIKCHSARDRQTSEPSNGKSIKGLVAEVAVGAFSAKGELEASSFSSVFDDHNCQLDHLSSADLTLGIGFVAEHSKFLGGLSSYPTPAADQISAKLLGTSKLKRTLTRRIGTSALGWKPVALIHNPEKIVQSRNPPSLSLLFVVLFSSFDPGDSVELALAA
ncbi:hypothetical protein I317_03750 [Kwoniella heveanensis CBS 569]|nr:hypothetical protein I317_03750 [Kwoniella heveanensis CBS 569]